VLKFNLNQNQEVCSCRGARSGFIISADNALQHAVTPECAPKWKKTHWPHHTLQPSTSANHLGPCHGRDLRAWDTKPGLAACLWRRQILVSLDEIFIECKERPGRLAQMGNLGVYSCQMSHTQNIQRHPTCCKQADFPMKPPVYYSDSETKSDFAW